MGNTEKSGGHNGMMDILEPKFDGHNGMVGIMEQKWVDIMECFKIGGYFGTKLGGHNGTKDI